MFLPFKSALGFRTIVEIDGVLSHNRTSFLLASFAFFPASDLILNQAKLFIARRPVISWH